MDIVIFSTADWDNPFWTNKQHMAKTFEENGHRVIYIDSLGLRKPTATARDIKRILKRLKSLFVPYSHVSKNIWKISPFIIPFHSNKFISFVNKWILVSFVKVLAFFLGFKKPIIWTYSPITDQIVDAFDSDTLVYHCVDDLSASPGMDTNTIREREETLTGKADVVFTTSQALYDRLFPLNSHTHYQNNVCDYTHFAEANKNIFDEPEDISEISGPKILFIGALSDYKVDFELIASIATIKKEWQWIMIGEIGEGQPSTSIGTLLTMKNVHFIGPKAYKTLPEYLQYADVTVIPAQLNAYTESMFPMKFFEYLSAGKQVVTTNLSSLKQYEEIYFNSTSRDEFLQNLELILEENVTKDREKILTVCLEQTWQKRYEEMMKILKAVK
ncbi:MAG: glycosyltransferase [Sulfurovum sp.]|nr:glycosyltransferase [Sulfurovum sp.]